MSDARPQHVSGRPSLPIPTLIAYSLPAAGVGLNFWLFSLYFFKYAVDTLLVAPAAMGLVMALGRIWDAVSDPLAGYLSDRTRSRLGRRRPWILASILPLGILPVVLWAPPAGIDGLQLILWVAVALLAFETATTAFLVPHTALGAELSMDYHDRTRVFAFRHVAWSAAFLACAGSLYLLTTADDKRTTALVLVSVASAVCVVFVAFGALRLREPSAHQGRGSASPLRAFADVWRNPHARLLLVVFLIESGGMATLGLLAPHFMQYVVGAEWLFSVLLLAHFVPTLLVVPFVLPLARRIGKKRAWVIGMSISGLSFTAFLLAGPGDIVLVCIAGFGTGIGTGIGAVVGPSIQADVIDYDEYTTGERKEGTYFAIWNFTRKMAIGIVAGLAGVSLQYAGFEPNQEQTETARTTIRLLYSAFPGAAFAIGTILFLRFDLTEEEHRRIQRDLGSS